MAAGTSREHVAKRPSEMTREALGLVIIWQCAFGVSMALDWLPKGFLLAGFVAWLALAIATDSGRTNALLRSSRSMIFFILLNTMIDLLVLGDVSQLIVNFFIIWILYLVGGFYTGRFGRFRAGALAILFVDTAIILYVTLDELRTFPNIVRLASTADGVSALAISHEPVLIATYSLVYACVVLAIFLFSLAVWSGGRARVFALVLAVGMSWWVFQTSFAIALVVLLLLLAVIVLDRIFDLGFAGKSALVLCLFSLILMFREAVGRYIGSWGNSVVLGDILSGKSSDLATGLQEGSDAMSNLRVELYIQSLSVFLNNILLGVHSMPGSVGFVGGHSGWVDGLAWFGLLRYGPFVFFVWKLKRPHGVRLTKAMRASYDSAFLAVILIGLVNPIIFPQIWLVLLVVIPFCFDAFSGRSVVDVARIPPAAVRSGRRTAWPRECADASRVRADLSGHNA